VCRPFGSIGKKRCEKAGLSDDKIKFTTKPQLAWEVIKRQVELGNSIDFVAGDGLYGKGYSLIDGFDE
jgi:SRSO17 transposase